MDENTIYCPRNRHFKDVLVCSVSCAHSSKCRPYQDRVHSLDAQDELERRVDRYLEEHPGRFEKCYSLEIVKIMKEETYLVFERDGGTKLLSRTELMQLAEKGNRYTRIYRVTHEMELQYRLVPRSEHKAKRKTETAPAVEEDSPLLFEESEMDLFNS